MKFCRRFALIGTAMFLVAMLCSCPSSGSGAGSADASEEAVSAESSAIQECPVAIEDIQWAVKNGVVEGHRLAVLECTNNSDYIIWGFGVQTVDKADVTQEQIEAVAEGAMEWRGLTREELDEHADTSCLEMTCETEMLIRPGETVSTPGVYCFSGYSSLMNADHFAYGEPDIAYVRYLDGDTVRAAYYDFKSGEYSMSDETQPAAQWSEHEIGKMLPKPEALVIETGYDDEDWFSFYAYGMTTDQVEAYIQLCKDDGYTIDPDTSIYDYEAKSDSGYVVRVNYYESEQCMSVDIELNTEGQ